MKPKRQTYQQRAEHFAKVCDIAVEVLSEADIADDEKTRMIKISHSDKQMALFPQSMYKRIDSLKCIESENLWYWNEHHGLHIDKFWQKIKDAGLDYYRKDIFQIVLKRSRISNRTEYDYVIDEILVAEQLGRITPDEAKRLNSYLLNYENSRK